MDVEYPATAFRCCKQYMQLAPHTAMLQIKLRLLHVPASVKMALSSIAQVVI